MVVINFRTLLCRRTRRKIKGIGALDHYTLSQDNNRFIGDIEIYNEEFDETYYGFENHNGMTF